MTEAGPQLCKKNPAAENPRTASTEVSGMVKIILFTGAMEVVRSLISNQRQPVAPL